MNDCKNCKMTDEYCASGDCNSQNTKNEQQKDLCITSEQLTEQWKKGELLEGFYYVRCAWSDEVEIRYVHNGVDDWKEIFAEVPDYVEWRNMVNCACEEHEANKRLIEENAQLKEVLKIILSKTKTCYSMVFQKDIISAELNETLLKKIDEVLK